MRSFANFINKEKKICKKSMKNVYFHIRRGHFSM